MNDKRATFESNTRQTSWHNSYMITIKNKRAKIDMARLNVAISKAGSTRKRQSRLRNIVARLGDDTLVKFFSLICSAIRANEHTIAPRLANYLHYQRVQMLKHITT